jgi:hypothetical protein
MLSPLSAYPDIMIFVVTAERTSILDFSQFAMVSCAELRFVLGGSPLRIQPVSRLNEAVSFLTYVLAVLGSNLVRTLSILSFLSFSWQMPRQGLKLGHGRLLMAGLNPDFR